MQPERLNTYRDLDGRGFGSRVTIWRKVRAGKFPPPTYIDDGQPRWRESKLIAWLAARDAAEAPNVKTVKSDNGEAGATK